MTKIDGIQKNPCYGCRYYTKFEDEIFCRCGVTGFHIDEKLIAACKEYGWKNPRWQKANSRRKQIARAK